MRTCWSNAPSGGAQDLADEDHGHVPEAGHGRPMTHCSPSLRSEAASPQARILHVPDLRSCRSRSSAVGQEQSLVIAAESGQSPTRHPARLASAVVETFNAIEPEVAAELASDCREAAGMPLPQLEAACLQDRPQAVHLGLDVRVEFPEAGESGRICLARQTSASEWNRPGRLGSYAPTGS